MPAGTALDAAREWAEWIAGRDADLGEALRKETSVFVSQFARPEFVQHLLEVQCRYDEGGDSYDAFGLPRPPPR